MPPKSAKTDGLSRGQRRRRNRKQRVEQQSEGRQLARQNVRNATPAGPKAALDLLHMLSLPHDVDPVRLPTRDMPKTEVLRLRQPDSLREVIDFAPSAKTYVAVYGHPSLSWMKRLYSPSSCRWEYGPGTPQGSWLVRFRDIDQGDRFFRAPLAPKTANQSIEGQSRKIPILTAGAERYFYMPSNSTLTITADAVTNVGSTQDLYCATNFSIKQYRGGTYTTCSEHVTINTTPKPIVATWECLQEGWYAVECSGLTCSPDSSTVTFDHLFFKPLVVTLDKGWLWEMYHMETLDTSRAIGQEIRRTSASLLLTNTTSALSRQGAVVAGRLLRSAPGQLNESDITTLLNSSYDQYTGPADKGVYTFMAFDDADEAFEESINPEGGLQVSASYLEAGYMNVITISNANMISAPNTYLTAFDMVVEFKGSSSLHRYLVPSGSFLDLVEMRRINNATAYFYENPLHWSSLSKYLQSAWNLFRRNATKVGTIASVAFPEASPLIMPVARALQA